MKIVQGCLCAGKVQQSRFNHSSFPVKLVYACLCTGKDQENSCYLYRGPVKLE